MILNFAITLKSINSDTIKKSKQYVMSFKEQLETYRPQFQEAYKTIRQDNPGTYDLKDLKLKESADLAAWEPDRSVLQYIPNFHCIRIEMINETTDDEQVMAVLLQEKSAGLVVLGQEISRHAEPSLIVITTTTIYFLIDPRAGDKGLSLLRRAIHEPGLTLWTTDGLCEADSLFANYKIMLKDSNAQCCLGLHIHIIKTLSAQKNDVMLNHYPEEAMQYARRSDLRLVKFHQLLRIWLCLDNERIFHLDPRQTIHFDTRPLSLTAKNLILKRCCLVLKLAEALEFYSSIEFSTMNRRVLECLSDASHPTTKLMKSIMEEDERDKTVSNIYLSHLDEPTICVQPPKPLIPLTVKQSKHNDL